MIFKICGETAVVLSYISEGMDNCQWILITNGSSVVSLSPALDKMYTSEAIKYSQCTVCLSPHSSESFITMISF